MGSNIVLERIFENVKNGFASGRGAATTHTHSLPPLGGTKKDIWGATYYR